MKKEILKIEIKINNDETDSIQINGSASPFDVARALMSLNEAKEKLMEKCPMARLLTNYIGRTTVSRDNEVQDDDIPDSFVEFLKSISKKDEE